MNFSTELWITLGVDERYIRQICNAFFKCSLNKEVDFEGHGVMRILHGVIGILRTFFIA